MYPRSFADGDGDGMGDLSGITGRLPHLVDLGVDAVWLTPFYPSPGFDHGYDVADYRGVDPAHGSLDHFDVLVTEAHRLGLRVIIDIVPNHTSSHHPWFREAVADPSSPRRDYYLWRDPAPDGGPPHNVVSFFGGSAWAPDPGGSGQYYCHLFLPEQPDLDWSNPAVLDEFDAILTFWCERGVDGFRIDVANSLTKDPWFRDNPQLRTTEGVADPIDLFLCFEHRYDIDQNSNVAVFRRWNRLVAGHGALLLGEVGLVDPVRLARYHDQGAAIHRTFYLEPPGWRWEPLRLRDGIRGFHLASPGSVAWTIDNHDSARSASRFGGGDRGRLRSLTVTTLMAGLGGMLFLWQGQELGLENGVIAPEDLTDPISTRNPGATAGRDVTRTPMPWDDGPNNGFTTAGRAWLHAQPRDPADTVAGQRGVEGSWLERHRRLLVLRREHPELWTEPLQWLDTDAGLLMTYRRGDTIVTANLDEYPTTLPLPPGAWTVAFSSDNGTHEPTGSAIEVPPETALVVVPST